MQDIIPPKKRSIRDIPLPENKSRIFNETTPPPVHTPTPEPVHAHTPPVSREMRQVQRNFEPETFEEEPDFEEEISPRKNISSGNSGKKRSKKKMAFLSTLFVVLVLVIFLISRESSKVYIYAKELTQSANISIGLSYNPLEITSEKS
ncbi:MAG: hypothetical protein RLY43_2017, partial [Bacteroidota bacterium]